MGALQDGRPRRSALRLNRVNLNKILEPRKAKTRRVGAGHASARGREDRQKQHAREVGTNVPAATSQYGASCRSRRLKNDPNRPFVLKLTS
jgi:hypothetical protein